jgi:hypothetical protein
VEGLSLDELLVPDDVLEDPESDVSDFFDVSPPSDFALPSDFPPPDFPASVDDFFA